MARLRSGAFGGDRGGLGHCAGVCLRRRPALRRSSRPAPTRRARPRPHHYLPPRVSPADPSAASSATSSANRCAARIVSAIGMTMASAVTDQSGRFAIDALPAGEYLVRAHLTGFAASRREPYASAAPRRSCRSCNFVDSSWSPAPRAHTLPSRPIVAAGFQLPQADKASGDAADRRQRRAPAHRARMAAPPSETQHPEERIRARSSSRRHPEFPQQGSLFGRAFDGATGLAAALFSDVPFSGEVNLLTTSAFGPGELFRNGPAMPRGIAYFAIGSPTPAGEWTVRAAMSEGDLASWIVAGSFASRAGRIARLQRRPVVQPAGIPGWEPGGARGDGRRRAQRRRGVRVRPLESEALAFTRLRRALRPLRVSRPTAAQPETRADRRTL